MAAEGQKPQKGNPAEHWPRDLEAPGCTAMHSFIFAFEDENAKAECLHEDENFT